MTPLDAAIVRRKLGHIMTSLDLLRPMRAMPLSDYQARVWERKGVERVLQEKIEAALDINAQMIAERGLDVPDDCFGGFIKLGELGILSRELAAALAPSAGLRNRLVHEYDPIDDGKVLAAVGTMPDLDPRYIAHHAGFCTNARVISFRDRVPDSRIVRSNSLWRISSVRSTPG